MTETLDPQERVFWLLHDTDGRIDTHGEAPRRQAEIQGRPGMTLLIHATPNVSHRTHWVDAGEVVDRPSLTPFAGGPAPLILDMAELPEGTLVRATNNAGTVVETTDPADPVRLTAPGAYAVQIRPPFPWRDLNQTVEVSDA